MTVLTGGCQCGAVRYRFKGTPGHSGICHCRMCQKASGNFGLTLVSLPFANFTWTRGKPSEFRSSPPVARGFCKDCGTPLYMHDDGDTNYEITVGSLDDPNATPPTTQVGIESEVSWFSTLATLPAKTTDQAVTPDLLARYKSLQHPDHD